MHHRSALTMLAAAIALLLLATSPPPAAHADAPDATTATSLTVEPPRPGKQPHSLLITALLTGADGEPLEGYRIEFLVDVDFPGAERLVIGSKTTDATGKATIRYQPSWDGTHSLSARSQRSGTHPSATAEISIEVSGAARTYAEAPRGLEPLRKRLPLAIGGLVLAVWATLAFVALRTVLGIAGAGRGAHGVAGDAPHREVIRSTQLVASGGWQEGRLER